MQRECRMYFTLQDFWALLNVIASPANLHIYLQYFVINLCETLYAKAIGRMATVLLYCHLFLLRSFLQWNTFVSVLTSCLLLQLHITDIKRKKYIHPYLYEHSQRKLHSKSAKYSVFGSAQATQKSSTLFTLWWLWTFLGVYTVR